MTRIGASGMGCRSSNPRIFRLKLHSEKVQPWKKKTRIAENFSPSGHGPFSPVFSHSQFRESRFLGGFILISSPTIRRLGASLSAHLLVAQGRCRRAWKPLHTGVIPWDLHHAQTASNIWQNARGGRLFGHWTLDIGHRSSTIGHLPSALSMGRTTCPMRKPRALETLGSRLQTFDVCSGWSGRLNTGQDRGRQVRGATVGACHLSPHILRDRHGGSPMGKILPAYEDSQQRGKFPGIVVQHQTTFLHCLHL